MTDLQAQRLALEYALGVPFTENNRVIALQNGDQIFPAVLSAIDQATTSVDFVTFVYWSGDIAEQFAEALARAAARGLRVRVLLDAFGFKPMSRKADKSNKADTASTLTEPKWSWCTGARLCAGISGG